MTTRKRLVILLIISILVLQYILIIYNITIYNNRILALQNSKTASLLFVKSVEKTGGMFRQVSKGHLEVQYKWPSQRLRVDLFSAPLNFEVRIHQGEGEMTMDEAMTFVNQRSVARTVLLTGTALSFPLYIVLFRFAFGFRFSLTDSFLILTALIFSILIHGKLGYV